ncbi:protein-L-isoaspartate O-methyltransferase family protein [Nesterenkonia haasae]|uniref:protein-L-isoaspartate O-methyltransferase family protein n=1 Tax=Nesterenkonia haasae TaxID=2587813 RepID=UPI001F30C398|nr:protein-L-isoaspartate O-methyltransferase [Nesterenkonia haasae]
MSSHSWMRRRQKDDVEKSMTAIRRADFLPEEVRHLADLDEALPIGFSQTNSQPRTVKSMLQLLEVRPGHKILDVGAGSGWSTGLLGHLVGEQGRVIGVELVPELVNRANAALDTYGMPWIEVRQASRGELGLRGDSPFHRILVSAEADHLPESLIEQLHMSGIMVIPVRGEMLRVEKRPNDVAVTRHGPFSFVPLR